MVHADGGEIERLARTGTNVVHCPAASLRSGVGVSCHGQGAGVDSVLVDGEVIVRHGHLVRLDEAEAYRAIDAAARDLFARMDVPDLPFGP